MLITGGEPKEEAINFAEEQPCPIIFIGSRSLRAMDRFIIGSFSQYVTTHARCPVMLVKKATVTRESNLDSKEPWANPNYSHLV
jgi:nucleotide-binding universal stress UspA family protein